MNVDLQDLLRKKVRDQQGKVVGRIEEVIGEQEGDNLFVEEFHTGDYAMLEHLTTITIGEWLPRLITRETKSYIIRWDQIDISNPDDIRLTCGRSELKERE